MLTYEEYAQKLKDLLEHDGRLDLPAINLLRFGRHLRLSDKVKIIIGKDATENDQLERLAKADDLLLEAPDYAGPITLYIGPKDDATLKLAAAITAGYSNAPADAAVTVKATNPQEQLELVVQPLPREESRKYFVNRVE